MADQVQVVLPRMKPFWAIALSIFLLIWILYFNLPVFNLSFVNMGLTLFFVFIPLLFIVSIRRFILKLQILVFTLMVILPFVLGWPIFRAPAWRNLIGEVKETEFNALMAPIDIDQALIGDRNYISLLAEKKLGEDFALGSRVTLGKPDRQMVKGELVWVIPLLHSGFFKWLANTDIGTPGFLIVKANNPQDITFVREVKGKPVHLRYQPSSYFNQNLHRHIYLKGLVNKGITDFTFELDDEGRPFWTATVYRKKIGAMGNDAVGVAVVDPESGDMEYFTIDKAPAWIDRIQPAEFVINQLDAWGQYVHGFWNSLFGKRDLLTTTFGYNIVYGKDDKCYYYTGLSSVGADEGAIGFALVNSRTKETHLYKISGATEAAAMQSAEGKVQNFNYRATFPILINLSDVPTFFMSLKDSSGLVKMFAFVSVKDYSLVGVGETVKTARDSYLSLLSTQRVDGMGSLADQYSSTKGKVTRFGQDTKEGRTYYFVTVDSRPGKVFTATSGISETLPVTREGDIVSLTFIDTSDMFVNLTRFRNHTLFGGNEPVEADTLKPATP